LRFSNNEGKFHYENQEADGSFGRGRYGGRVHSGVTNAIRKRSNIGTCDVDNHIYQLGRPIHS